MHNVLCSGCIPQRFIDGDINDTCSVGNDVHNYCVHTLHHITPEYIPFCLRVQVCDGRILSKLYIYKIHIKVVSKCEDNVHVLRGQCYSKKCYPNFDLFLQCMYLSNSILFSMLHVCLQIVLGFICEK